MSARPKIGAHVSASGGLWRAPENARAIGAECFQIFGASPRVWKAALPVQRTVSRFTSLLKECSLDAFYLHASYLVNLASADRELARKSAENLHTHFEIANLLNARGLIFHLGSSKAGSRSTLLKQEAEAIGVIIKSTPGPSALIMENTAGGGDKLGSVEDIAFLYETVNSSRLKVCLDTAHAFESGLIRTYNVGEIAEFFKKWDGAVGLKNIPVLHINDSKTPAGSRSDRHENIGEGAIGLAGFRALAQNTSARSADWILEVPGFDGVGPDEKNIDILKRLFLE